MKLLQLMLLIAVVASWPAAAQEAEDTLTPIVDKVVATYGGKALTGLRNYEIVESYTQTALGQSWSPALTEVNKFNTRLVHDIENQRLYQETWFKGRGGVFPNILVVNDEKAWNLNLQAMRFGEAASADPYATSGGVMRTTDTLLARELHRAGDAAEYLGDANWMNRPHHMVRIPFPQSPELTLYIDTESGVINRMTRDNPQLGLLDYTFSGHQLVDGLVAARFVNFAVAGDPNLMSSGRKVRFNQPVNAALFVVPESYVAEAERIATSEMVVNRLAKNVYHIGQNGGYSIFVDTGSEVIGSGGYAGLSDRLAKFQEATGTHRPLRYQVVTHHHSDHLGGIDEALGLGATLVTVDANIEPIREVSQRQPESGRFLSVNNRMTLGEGSGRVELYDVSTIHANSNLLVYVPATRTLFMADHFGDAFAAGVPTPNRNTVSMAEALDSLDLGYNKIVTAHNARVYTARDFAASVAAFEDFECPQDHPVCAI